MTNREKYAEEILDIACYGGKIAVEKATGKLCDCMVLQCIECEFNSNSCCESREKWANTEYIEKPKISKWDKEYLSYLVPEWKYIARDQNGHLRAFCSKPHKDGEMWSVGVGFRLGAYSLTYGHNLQFPMVKWEDEEPWLVEDLKKLEVIESYENN